MRLTVIGSGYVGLVTGVLFADTGNDVVGLDADPAKVAALQRGEKIELRGFGSFRLRRREPRKGRNPKTGDRVDVPPKKVPYFKPGKELKELINRTTPGASEVGAASPLDVVTTV